MARRTPGERWNCAACGAELIGAQSSANPANVMPVRVEPASNGNVLLQQKDGVLTGFVFGNRVILGALQDAGVVMRLNHFADCPGRDQFARRAEPTPEDS